MWLWLSQSRRAIFWTMQKTPDSGQRYSSVISPGSRVHAHACLACSLVSCVLTHTGIGWSGRWGQWQENAGQLLAEYLVLIRSLCIVLTWIILRQFTAVSTESLIRTRDAGCSVVYERLWCFQYSPEPHKGSGFCPQLLLLLRGWAQRLRWESTA